MYFPIFLENKNKVQIIFKFYAGLMKFSSKFQRNVFFAPSKPFLSCSQN